MKTKNNKLFDKQLLRESLRASVRKLAPRTMIKNPIMFTVEIVTAMMLTMLFYILLSGDTSQGTFGYNLVIFLVLLATLLFANFAEAIAEARGKAQADSLRKTREETPAKLVAGGSVQIISSSALKKNDIFECVAGDTIPADGEIIEGLASIDESAITGESAPVIREAGGDKSSVTGGTKVLSDRIRAKVTAQPGESFLDKMIAAGVRVLKIEGRARGAEYVKRVVECYDQALKAMESGTYTPALTAELKERLRTVFNRGFWEGYYAGRPVVEHSPAYGSSATQRKVYVGKVVNFYKKLSVAEVSVEAAPLAVGEPIFFLGATTGVAEQTLTELHGPDGQPAESVAQGELCAIRTPGSLSLHDTQHRQTDRPAIDRAVFFPSFSHPYKDASSASNKSFRIRRIRNERFLILHRTKNSWAA